MQPIELKALIEDAVRQGLTYPWWSVVLAAIAAGIGAFAASYLHRKGEDTAARENFAAIREQLRATTKDTEEIKQFLSGEAWRLQRQWTAREQYYGNLLTHLHAFRLALFDLSDYYMEPGSEHTPDSQQGEYFHKLLDAGHQSYKEVQKLLGPAALYLSAQAVKSLENLHKKHWELAQFSSCTAEYVNEALAMASSA